MNKIHLWRLDDTVGRWVHERECAADTAQAWLSRFQSDAPHATFTLAEKRPITESERTLRRLARERKR